jgi:hypothetical protein
MIQHLRNTVRFPFHFLSTVQSNWPITINEKVNMQTQLHLNIKDEGDFLFGVTQWRLHIITPSQRLTNYFVLSQLANLIYCRRSPAALPVQIKCLRCIGPLVTGITAPASWFRYRARLVFGRRLCYTSPYLWFRFHGTSSKGFVRFSLRSNSLLSSSWIASTLSWRRSLPSWFRENRPISTVTISIRRSLWRSAFRTFQGASAMFLSTMSILSIMAMLLGFVHPHNWMP